MIGNMREGGPFVLADKALEPLILCGFPLHALAFFCAYYRPIQMDPTAQAASIVTPTALMFSLGLALIFAAIGVAWRPAGRLTRRPWFLAAATFAFVISMIAASQLPPSSVTARLLDFVARTAGIFLLVGWLHLFDVFDNNTMLGLVPSIVAVGLAAATVVILMGPQGRIIAMTALAVGGTAALTIFLRATDAAAPPQQPSTPEKPSDERATETLTSPATPTDRTAATPPKTHVNRVFFIAFLLSLLLGVLCALPFASHALSSNEPFFLYFLLAMGTALLLLSFATLLGSRDPVPASLLRWRLGLPVILVASVLATFSVAQPPISPWVNAISRVAMDLSLLIGFLLASRHFQAPPVRVFAFGQAAFMAGNSLGTLLGLGIPRFIAIPSDHLLVTSVVLLLLTTEAVLVFALLYRFSQRHSVTAAPFEPSLDSAAATPAPAAPHASQAPEDNESLDRFIADFSLSDQEARVLRLTIRGRSRQRIAESLYVSLGTVNRYFSRIYQKVGVHTRQELLDKVEELSNEDNELFSYKPNPHAKPVPRSD